MAKTLDQLRTETAFWLDDPKKTKFDNPYLDSLIGIAYPIVVSVVESAGRLWNLSRTRIAFAVTSAAREYVFDDDMAVRRPVLFHRVESITAVSAIASNLGRTRLTLRPATESSSSGPYYPALENSSVGEGVYCYRSSAGEWVLGFEALAPRDQVIEVSYIPSIEDLTTDGQYPLMVPPDFHHIIAMRAAMLAKGSENRMNEQVLIEYARAEAMMMAELSSLQAHVSQRF
jgi:hypothetical protein